MSCLGLGCEAQLGQETVLVRSERRTGFVTFRRAYVRLPHCGQGLFQGIVANGDNAALSQSGPRHITLIHYDCT